MSKELNNCINIQSSQTFRSIYYVSIVYDDDDDEN
jgi:hypothetical protein